LLYVYLSRAFAFNSRKLRISTSISIRRLEVGGDIPNFVFLGASAQ